MARMAHNLLHERGVTPTFKNLLQFVLVNRKDKVFLGYDEAGVIYLLEKGIRENSLYYETDLEGNILGMILANLNHKKKEVFVTENMAMSLSRLKRFAQKLKAALPGYTISAVRHGKERHFNTPKLYTKLT